MSSSNIPPPPIPPPVIPPPPPPPPSESQGSASTSTTINTTSNASGSNPSVKKGGSGLKSAGPLRTIPSPGSGMMTAVHSNVRVPVTVSSASSTSATSSYGIPPAASVSASTPPSVSTTVSDAKPTSSRMINNTNSNDELNLQHPYALVRPPMIASNFHQATSSPPKLISAPISAPPMLDHIDRDDDDEDEDEDDEDEDDSEDTNEDDDNVLPSLPKPSSADNIGGVGIDTPVRVSSTVTPLPPPPPAAVAPVAVTAPPSIQVTPTSTMTSQTPTKSPTKSRRSLLPSLTKKSTNTPSNTPSNTNSEPPSLEVEADHFLLHSKQHPIQDQQQQQQQQRSKLHPSPPLTTTASPMDRLYDLVNKRAWNDVLQVTLELLTSSESVYEPLYSDLTKPLTHHNPTDFDTIDHDYDTARTKMVYRETAQILQWRLMAMTKLRKYTELRREIVRLHLLEDLREGMPRRQLQQRQSQTWWVPTSLKMDAAQMLQYGRVEETREESSQMEEKERGDGLPKSGLEALYSLQSLFSSSSSSSSSSSQGLEGEKVASIRWECRMQTAFSNAFVREKEWRLALLCLEKVLEMLPSHTALAVDGAFDILEEFADNQDDDDDEKGEKGDEHQVDDALNVLPDGRSWEEQKERLVEVITRASRIDIFSRQGRILLQAGALPEAATVFECAHDEFLIWRDLASEFSEWMRRWKEAAVNANVNAASPSSSSMVVMDALWRSRVVRQVPTQILLNEGLLHFAHMEYENAMTKFAEAVDLERREHTTFPQHHHHANNTIMSSGYFYITCDLLETEDNLLSPCLNNLALSALYTCRMREAVEMMEALIRQDPTRFLTECMVFNLCTLYELGSDNAVSEKKKKVLQLIAKRFYLQDVGSFCFRVN